MNRKLAFAVLLIGGLVLAWWALRTPKPLDVQAPPAAFSAGRAMIDDRVIARAPHPVGSSANAAVRDYLVERLRNLGLAPQVQRSDAVRRVARSPEPLVLGAVVENVVGVLPGRDRNAPALAIMAHYDSVPGSPGGSDDAAGVSTALEVVRALKLKGTPARDVIVVITDGEEAGLLGAAAFFRANPLARRVGFVLNMDTRGGSGQSLMTQTGADNGQVIDLYARTAPRPIASSLIDMVAKHLPNDTDFTVAREAGLTGMNFAFIGRQFDYHSPTSTSDALDQGSLQHMGEQVLGPALALAFDPALPGKAPDKVYAQLMFWRFLAYPAWAGWIPLGLAAVLIGIGVWRARKAFSGVDLARGIGAAVYLCLLAVALFSFARRLTGAGSGWYEQRVLLAQASRWELAVLLIGLGSVLYVCALAGRGRSRTEAAVIPLVAGAASSAFGLDLPMLAVGGAGALVGLVTFGRPAGIAGTWTGLLLVALALGVAAQVAAPAGAFVFGWPLVAAALGGALSGMGAVRPPWATTALAVLGALALGWILAFAHGLYLALDLVALFALPAGLAALLIWPLAQTEDEDHGPRGLAITLLVLGVLVATVVRIFPPWTARHPRATEVTYAVDVDHDRARRVSLTPDLPPWSEKALRADGGKLARVAIPGVTRAPAWSAEAMSVPAAGPTVTLARQPDGSLLLTAVPPAGARVLNLNLTSKVAISGATVNGWPVKLLEKPGEVNRLRFQAVPEGVALRFRAAGPGEIEARYASVTEAWPAAAKPLPPRDAKTMAFGGSDSTIAYGARRFTW